MEVSRTVFILSMFFETFFALASVGMLFNEVGAIVYLYAIAVFAAVLTPFFIRLKKAQDERKKEKIRRNIALILLIPIVAGVIAFLYVAAVLAIAFAR